MLHFQPVHVVAVFSHEPMTTDFLKRALDSAGFATFAAPSDLAGLEAFVQAVEPDAVVVDVAASADSEWQDLVRLRNRPPFRDIPLVITTGDAREGERHLAGTASGVARIVEMFTSGDDLRNLRAAVHTAIGSVRHSDGTTRLTS